MTLAHSFSAAYRRIAVSPHLPAVGDQLAVATAEVTGVDGIVLVAFDRVGLALPIGASSAQTALAERLQFTVGHGPGYDSHTGRRTVVAIEPEMARDWPAFHDLLVTQTSFRSVVAMPLTGPLKSMMTVIMLFGDANAAARAPVTAMSIVGRLISAELIEADLMADTDESGTPSESGEQPPVWLSSPNSVARYQVMVAAGMLTTHLQVSTNSALKVLKARAYADRSTTDDVAAALIAGRLSPSMLLLDD